jgi:hypothetical protein
MKCHYCNRQAEKINIVETRLGGGTTIRREPVCHLHLHMFEGRYERPQEAGLIEISEGGYQAIKTTSGG